MSCRAVVIAVLSGICMVLLGQQQTGHDAVTNSQRMQVPSTKFLLSELEKSKLETLQVKRNYMQALRHAQEMEQRLMALSLESEVEGYEHATLQAHHNPVGVTLKADTLEWVVGQPPQEQK